jgi:hypothetical protein
MTGPSLAQDRDCVVLHTPLRPYEHHVAADHAQRRDVVWRAGEVRVEGRLRGVYQRGARAWIAVECQQPELRSKLRLATARLEVP